MGAAVALQRAFRGRAVFRTLFLIPYAIPMYAGIIAWKFMFQQQTGVIDQILVFLHLATPTNQPFWLIGPNAFVALCRRCDLAHLAVRFPHADGRTADASTRTSTRPRHSMAQSRSGNGGAITLPELGGVNRVLVLVLFLWTFNDFNDPAILFGEGQPPSGDLISFHIYNNAFIDPELRIRCGNVDAAADLPADRLGRVPALCEPEVHSCVKQSDSKSSASLYSLVLACFVILPLYVMITTAIKPPSNT